MKEKWEAHLTKKLAHYNCLTMQRSESSHRALNVGLTKRINQISVFEHINKHWISLECKFNMIEQEEHQKQDTLTGSNRKLDLIRHKSALAGADIYQEYWVIYMDKLKRKLIALFDSTMYHQVG